MTATYRMSADDFDQLAHGYGDMAAVADLARAQESRRLLQVYAVVATARARLPAARTAHLVDAYELLAHVQRTAPQAARVVLAHPYTGAWAMRCLARLALPDPTSGHPDLDRLLGHLAAIAAAAALRADPEHGLAGPIDVFAVDGWAHLPTLGRLPAGTCRVTLSGPRVPSRAEANRTCSAQAGDLSLTLAIEDLDPYRDVHRWVPTPRLTDRQVSLLRSNFAQAWGLLASAHRPYASALTVGLSTLVPVVAAPGVSLSSSSRYAFGGLALAPAVGPTTLAVTLVHEFQHNKLGALQDITPLSVRSTTRYRAPWRPDPRPVGALLQGAYAHLGIADFWRIRRHADTGEEQDRAQTEFAVHRAHVSEAVHTLRECGELTPAGARVVSAMADTLAPWWREDVPARAARDAAERVGVGRRAWFARNRRYVGRTTLETGETTGGTEDMYLHDVTRSNFE
jgi:uncharacterized protein